MERAMLLVRWKSALLAVALSLFCIVGTATASGVTDELTHAEAYDTHFKVYVVGGRCGDADSWYSKFSAAAVGSFTAIEKHICSPYEDGPFVEYGDAFHANALQEVELLASAHPTDAIVVTGGIPYGGDAELALVSVLRAGISVFHGFGEELDFDAHGLDVNSVRYLRLSPEVQEKTVAGELSGKELCRLKGVGHHIKLATYYASNRPELDYRVNDVIKGLTKYCDAGSSVLWSINATIADAANASAPYWAFRPVPEVIITPNDDTAAAVIESASHYLLEEDYRLLSSTGWDHSRVDLLNNRKLLTTVDQMVFYANEGYWHTLQLVIQKIEVKHLMSTAEMIENFDLPPLSMTLNTSAMITSSDPDGWLLSELMASYDARAAPVGVIEVSSGLHDVTITEFNAFDGLVEAVIWLKVSWYDLRLAWATRAHHGGVEISEDDVWVPPFYFLNEYDQAGLEHVPAYIQPDGKVTIEHNMRSTFLCSTTKPIRSFPFDSYKCYAELAIDHPEKHPLNGEMGFKVVDYDHDYIISIKVVDEHTEKRDIVHFTIEFDRRTFKTWARLIIPAILLNLVGFIAFWIPEGGDSIALGITTLLCTLALRESVELPDTSDITWSEIFVGICTAYQAIVMFFSFMDYQVSLSEKINAFFGRLGPNKVKVEGNGKAATADKDDGDAAKPMAAFDSDAEAPKKREPKRKSRMSGFGMGGRFSQFSPVGLKQREADDDDDITNIDWLGRWTVVPSYILIMAVMLTWVPSAL